MRTIVLYIFNDNSYFCEEINKNMDIKKKFALVTIGLRTQANPKLTQKEISEDVGISLKYYQKLEKGMCMPTLGVVERIAHVYGLSLKDFCEMIENMN